MMTDEPNNHDTFFETFENIAARSFEPYQIVSTDLGSLEYRTRDGEPIKAQILTAGRFSGGSVFYVDGWWANHEHLPSTRFLEGSTWSISRPHSRVCYVLKRGEWRVHRAHVAIWRFVIRVR